MRRAAPVLSMGGRRPSSSDRATIRRRESLVPRTSSTRSASIRSKTDRSSKPVRTSAGSSRSRRASTKFEASLSVSASDPALSGTRSLRQIDNATGHPAVRSCTSISSRRDSLLPNRRPTSALENRNCSVPTTVAEPSRTWVARSSPGLERNAIARWSSAGKRFSNRSSGSTLRSGSRSTSSRTSRQGALCLCNASISTPIWSANGAEDHASNWSSTVIPSPACSSAPAM